MKKSRKSMGRVFVLALAVVGLLAAMLVPASASSDSLTSSGASAFVFDGWARLPDFPTATVNQGDFDGELTGLSTAHGPVVRDGDFLDSKFGHDDGDHDDNIHAHGFNYNEISGPPLGCLAGFANGQAGVEQAAHTSRIDDVDTIDFEWIRVGATAVILLEFEEADGDGVATAAFEAEAKSGSLEQACLTGPTVAVNAYVVGAGWYQDVVDVLPL